MTTTSPANESGEMSAFAAFNAARPSPETGNLILPPSWHTLSQQLNHVAQFGGGVHVVNGPLGAGKSTFISLLLQKISMEELKCSIVVGEHDSSEVVLEKLLISLGISADKELTLGAAIAYLRNYVQSLRAEKQRAIVVIDDGHYIEDALLAGITSVLQGEGEEGFGLHLIFLAEPGLAERMDELQLVDVTVHDSDLPAFASSELFELFYKHFGDEDAGNGLPLNPDEINQIWTLSKGLPGLALAYAKDRMSEKVEDNLERGKLPILHLVSVGILILVLIGLFLWQKPDGQTTSDADPVHDAAAVEELVRFNISDSELDAQKVAPKSTETTIVGGAELQISEEKNNAISGESENSEDSLVDGELASAVDKPLREEVNSQIKPEPVSDLMSKAEETIEFGNADSAAITKSDKAVLNEKNLKPSDVKQNTPPKQSVASIKQVIPAKKKTNKIDAVSPVLALDSEKALLKLNSRGYVLQVMAASSEEALKDYRRRQPNKADLQLYRGERKGKPWYMLVEGYYADRGSALAAIQNLPSRQRRNQPWPKPISGVQSEIKEYLRQHNGVASGHQSEF